MKQLKKGKPIHYDNSQLSASFRTQKASSKNVFGMRSRTRDFASNPLEIQRFDFAIMVRIGGQVVKEEIEQNGLKILRSKWIGGMIVKAMAYDSQNAGYNTFNTVSVRLWSALPIFGGDCKYHAEIANQLRNVRAASGSEHRFKDIIQIRKNCEKITCVPYPKDSSQPLKIQELVI
jgi:starch phosphorylase